MKKRHCFEMSRQRVAEIEQSAFCKIARALAELPQLEEVQHE